MLFVCEDDERNICDQKVIEVRLQKQFGIHSMRLNLKEIETCSRFDEESKRLYVNGIEIGFVYYRTGYQADHYMVTGTQEWDD